MHIAIIGTGYVGLVTGACLADFGHNVVCVDANPQRVAMLGALELPFYEPGLSDIVERNVAAGRLEFTTDLQAAVLGSLVLFLAVGTPEGPGGEANLSQITDAVSGIAACVDGYRVIVTKSTVPAGTGRLIRSTLAGLLPGAVTCDVVSNPEFLREGSAVNDFMRPDRIVIGTESPQAAAILKDIYRPLYLIETPMLFTDVETAEMIKCASNAFLAVRISFINEIANLCECVGADVHGVARGMGLDKRIGSKFLHPGPGYGGSCFPKDTRALAALGARHGAPQRIVETTIEVNARQRQRIVEKVMATLDDVAAPVVTVLGLSFKPNTSDVRESSAVHLCARLASAGIRVKVYDPVATLDAQRELQAYSHAISYSDNIDDAVADASTVVIMTEWNEFRALDLERLGALAARRVLVDARNVLDPERAVEAGFRYYATGRATVPVALAADAAPATA